MRPCAQPRTLPIATDTTPTARARGAPRHRNSTSGPKPSVPSTWVALGGRRRWPRLPGWWWTVSRTARPVSPPGREPPAPGRSWPRCGGGSVSPCPARTCAAARGGRATLEASQGSPSEGVQMSLPSGASPNARIGQPVQGVRHKVDQNHAHQKDADERLRERIVTREYRVHQQLAEGPPNTISATAAPPSNCPKNRPSTARIGTSALR